MHSAMLVCLFVLQCFAWTSSFVYRPCWTRRPATRNRILEKVQLTNSRLYSTKLRWEQIPPHIEDEQLDADGSPKLSALTGGHPAVTIDVDTLVQQWIDTCLAEGRASDADKFSLKSAIPLLTKKNTVVQLVNATLEASQAQDKSVTYISEEELKKLWVDGSYRAMGKPASGYSVQDALLLMDDGDELELLESAGKDDQLAVDDKEEVIITHQVHSFNIFYSLLTGCMLHHALFSCIFLYNRNWNGCGRTGRRSRGACLLSSLICRRR